MYSRQSSTSRNFGLLFLCLFLLLNLSLFPKIELKKILKDILKHEIFVVVGTGNNVLGQIVDETRGLGVQSDDPKDIAGGYGIDITKLKNNIEASYGPIFKIKKNRFAFRFGYLLGINTYGSKKLEIERETFNGLYGDHGGYIKYKSVLNYKFLSSVPVGIDIYLSKDKDLVLELGLVANTYSYKAEAQNVKIKEYDNEGNHGPYKDSTIAPHSDNFTIISPNISLGLEIDDNVFFKIGALGWKSKTICISAGLTYSMASTKTDTKTKDINKEDIKEEQKK